MSRPLEKPSVWATLPKVPLGIRRLGDGSGGMKPTLYRPIWPQVNQIRVEEIIWMKLARGRSLFFLRQKQCGYLLNTPNISDHLLLLFGSMTRAQDQVGFFGHTQQKQKLDKWSRKGYVLWGKGNPRLLKVKAEAPGWERTNRVPAAAGKQTPSLHHSRRNSPMGWPGSHVCTWPWEVSAGSLTVSPTKTERQGERIFPKRYQVFLLEGRDGSGVFKK